MAQQQGEWRTWRGGPLRLPLGKSDCLPFRLLGSCCGLRCAPPFQFLGLPWWLSGKESTCQCRRCGFDPWVGKMPWRRAWQPTPVSLPGEFHGQRSLAGYSPWGCKESDKRMQHKGKESEKEYICVYIYIYMTESLCCTPETNTML